MKSYLLYGKYYPNYFSRSGKIKEGFLRTKYIIFCSCPNLFIMAVILTNMQFGIATVSVKFCIPAQLVPQLLTTGLSITKNDNDSVSQINLKVTNPSMYCAPVTQNFYLNEIKYLTTCNKITVIMVPDINPLEIAYDVITSDGKIIMQGGYQSNSTVYCGKYNEQLVATMRDFGGDGYCCQYGGGSYYQVSSQLLSALKTLMTMPKAIISSSGTYSLSLSP